MTRRDVSDAGREAYAALADLAHAWRASLERGAHVDVDVATGFVQTLASIRHLEMQAELVLDDHARAEVRQ